MYRYKHTFLGMRHDPNGQWVQALVAEAAVRIAAQSERQEYVHAVCDAMRSCGMSLADAPGGFPEAIRRMGEMASRAVSYERDGAIISRELIADMLRKAQAGDNIAALLLELDTFDTFKVAHSRCSACQGTPFYEFQRLDGDGGPTTKRIVCDVCKGTGRG